MKMEPEKKTKNRYRTRSYERPRRNMDEFLKSVIQSPVDISEETKRDEKVESYQPVETGRISPITITQDVPKVRKNSLYSTESENSERRCEKIIRVKVTRTSDNRYTYGFISDDGTYKGPLHEKTQNKKLEIEERISAKSDRVRRAHPTIPQRRDTFTKKFEQSQKEAMHGIEAVYSRHSQRASQLLMDLQISMASNGYGKFRNFD